MTSLIRSETCRKEDWERSQRKYKGNVRINLQGEVELWGVRAAGRVTSVPQVHGICKQPSLNLFSYIKVERKQRKE